MGVRCFRPGAPRDVAVSPSEPQQQSAQFLRAYRLTRHAEFNQVLRQRSLRVSSGPFVALACATGKPVARLGLIVGRRQLPRAVDRNRIKRLVRESFRHERRRLPALDIVIQWVRAPGDDDPRAALEQVWARLRTGKKEGGEP